MKKSIIVLVFLVMRDLVTFAGDIPVKVQKSFDQKFPGASAAKWDKENAKEYEVSFVWKGATYSANFSNTGEWMETESTTSFSMIPESVQDAFNKTHQGVTPNAVAKIETSKGAVKYEVEFKQGAKTVELFYNLNGTESK